MGRSYPSESPKRRTPRPLHHKIHLGNDVWTYKVSAMNVKIRWPDCSQDRVVTLEDILGMSPDEIERAQWKKNNYANVTPGIVRDYIKDHLISS